MKKIIVTTTINSPTTAIIKFANKKDWDMIIVGDIKTPEKEYNLLCKEFNNVSYLNVDYQQQHYSKLSNLIGWNCIQRRNIGFIEAYKRNANIIATVDDDNIPYDTWGESLFINQKSDYSFLVNTNTGNCDDPLYINSIIENISARTLPWHRGFPVNRIPDRKKELEIKYESITFDVQADFWDGEPDVDAICRISNLKKEFSNDLCPFTCKNYSPFNSQNTFISRKAIKDYFMFPKIGRMDDIWASYYIESKGYKVVYNNATVFQERNAHNIIKDLENELIGYKYTEKLLEALSKDPENIKNFIPPESYEAFKLYQSYFGE